MQSARIWFRQSSPPITLSAVNICLNTLGAQVEETAWSLGNFVVPQLHIIRPVPFLLQLNDDEYIVEEAEEFSEFEVVPDEIRTKLTSCDARLEVGDVSENSIITDQGTTVIAGWTGFDPGHVEACKLLKHLTTKFDGIFEDNVNGRWWSA